MKTTLLTKDHLTGVSDPFEVREQVTVIALGLEPEDIVTLWMILLTAPQRDPCTCPPGQVVLPEVLDEVQHTCCGEPITLTRERPFVILDAPQDQKFRVKLNAHLEDGPGVLSTQVVKVSDTNTHNVNDRLRGCPCTIIED